MGLILKQCCCGCTLKTGTLIIAVVFAILAALQVVTNSVAVVVLSDRYRHLLSMAEEEERLTGTTVASVDDDGEPLGANETSHHHIIEHTVPFETYLKMTLIWKWCTILLSFTETIEFFLNIFLMFAANKDSSRHVFIWLVGFSCITCVRLLLHIILDGSIFYVDAVTGGIMLLTIASLIALGTAYSLLVVFSYYRQLVGTGVARRISQQDD